VSWEPTVTTGSPAASPVSRATRGSSPPIRSPGLRNGGSSASGMPSRAVSSLDQARVLASVRPVVDALVHSAPISLVSR